MNARSRWCCSACGRGYICENHAEACCQPVRQSTDADNRERADEAAQPEDGQPQRRSLPADGITRARLGF